MNGEEAMPDTLTGDDRAFIRAILDDPEELTTWLVYADWLDERSDPRAEYLRLSVERKQRGGRRAGRIDRRLTHLRRELDANWVLVFDTARLANCQGSGWRFVCPFTWDRLSPTDNPGIRICHTCKSPVFFCHTVEEAQLYTTSGQCVALSSRIPLDQLPQPEDYEAIVGLMVNLESELEDDDAAYVPDEPAPTPTPRPTRRPWWKFW
jgi:uncharacterized protein (TIGR02996 family)